MSPLDATPLIAAARAVGGLLSGETRELLSALDEAARDDDPERARKVIERYLEDARKLVTDLGLAVGASTQEAAAPDVRTQAEPPRGIDAVVRSVESAIAADPEAGFAELLTAYARALGDWDLELCARLATRPLESPAYASRAARLLHGGTRAIREGRHGDATDLVSFLVDVRTAEEGGAHVLDRSTRAALLVYLGRVALFQDDDPETAFELFRQAGALAPEEGLSLAALASYYRAREDPDQALALNQHAISVSPELPDGYVGMGLLAEDQGLVEEASGWYARALEAAAATPDALRALSRLLAPSSGTLYLQLADRLEALDADRALGALDRALSAGLMQQSDRRRAYALKGELLARAGEAQSAAAAFAQAGAIAVEEDAERAEKLLTRAVELDSQNQDALWNLADVRRQRAEKASDEAEARRMVDRAREAWDTAHALGPPDFTTAWVYVSRALMNEKLATFPKTDGWRLYWEAIALLERALVLGDEVYRWIYLTRFYRMVRLEHSALDASRQALEGAPEDTLALQERAAILAMTGDLVEAELAVDRSAEIAPSWAKWMKAWLAVRSRRPEEAVGLLDELVREEPDDVWNLNLRAGAHRRAGDRTRALADYEAIVGLVDDGARDTAVMRAYAHYYLAKEGVRADGLARAIQILEALSADPLYADFETHLDLGLCRLLTGELEDGTELVRSAFELAPGSPSLDDAILELEDLRASAPAAAGREIEGLTTEARDRRMKFVPATADSEHEELAAYATQGGEIGAAATARLARAALEAGQRPDAADLYGRLHAETGYPEARDGFRRALAEMLDEGDALLRERNTPAALGVLEAARSIVQERLADDRTLQAEIAARIALAHVRLEDAPAARSELETAVETLEAAGAASPLAAIVSDAAELWSLDDELAAIAARSDQTDRSERLSASLDRIYELAKLPYEYYYRRSIIGELGSGLVPENTGPEWSLFRIHIPDMRQRILGDSQLELPGVRFRPGRDLAPEEYRILLDELPYARAAVQGPSPLDEIDQVVRDLERVVRPNLADFLGLQEIGTILDRWRLEDPETVAAIDVLGQSRGSRHLLVRVVRALLREGVRLSDWRAVVHAMVERKPGDTDEAIVDAVRLAIREQLPGNEPGRRHLDLPHELEDRLARHLEDVRGRTLVSVSPYEVHRVSEALRDLLPPDEKVVVVTRRARLRPHLRRLLDAIAPLVPVLSEDEVVPAAEQDAGVPLREVESVGEG